MTYIEQELARLDGALDNGIGNPRYPEIYAARQALAWALDPGSARAPNAYLTGIPSS
jgi:hypothetical protein